MTPHPQVITNLARVPPPRMRRSLYGFLSHAEKDELIRAALALQVAPDVTKWTPFNPLRLTRTQQRPGQPKAEPGRA